MSIDVYRCWSSAKAANSSPGLFIYSVHPVMMTFFYQVTKLMLPWSLSTLPELWLTQKLVLYLPGTGVRSPSIEPQEKLPSTFTKVYPKPLYENLGGIPNPGLQALIPCCNIPVTDPYPIVIGCQKVWASVNCGAKHQPKCCLRVLWPSACR